MIGCFFERSVGSLIGLVRSFFQKIGSENRMLDKLLGDRLSQVFPRRKLSFRKTLESFFWNKRPFKTKAKRSVELNWKRSSCWVNKLPLKFRSLTLLSHPSLVGRLSVIDARPGGTNTF